MGTDVGDSNSVQPLKRVGIWVTNTVRTDSLDEVVPIRADNTDPRPHVMLRRVVPRTVVAGTALGWVDCDRRVAHVPPSELFRSNLSELRIR